MRYRAECKPTGLRTCRNCLNPPRPPKRYYCSDECRRELEVQHFWSDARKAALRRSYAGREAGGGWICARCGEVTHSPEVNHIIPRNGLPLMFGCHNHEENLETLCHGCHLLTTAEQRSAGLIGSSRVVEEEVQD